MTFRPLTTTTPLLLALLLLVGTASSIASSETALNYFPLGLGDCRVTNEPLLASSFRLPPNASDTRILVSAAGVPMCMQVDALSISHAINNSAADTGIFIGKCNKGPPPNASSTDDPQGFSFDTASGQLGPLFKNASGFCVSGTLTLSRCAPNEPTLQWEPVPSTGQLRNKGASPAWASCMVAGAFASTNCSSSPGRLTF